MGRAAESSAGQAAGLTKSLEIRSPTGKKPTEAAGLRVINTEGCGNTKNLEDMQSLLSQRGLEMTYQHICRGSDPRAMPSSRAGA